MSKKGKLFQKISILVALVMLITMAVGVSVMADTSNDLVMGDTCYNHGDVVEDGIITADDAIYLLYHSVFGEEAYPLVNYEYDKEEGITALDAIALLAKMGQSPTIHAYSEPVWQWTEEDGEVVAKAVFTCACKDEKAVKVYKANLAKEVVAPTCAKAGSITYEASVTLNDNQVYTTEKTVQKAFGQG